MGLMQGAPASCRPRRGTAHKHAAACGQAAQQRYKRAHERTGAACPGPAPVHPLTRTDEVSADRRGVPDLTPSTRQESEVGNTTALLQPKDKRDDLSGNALGENPEPPRPRKITARFQVFPQTPIPNGHMTGHRQTPLGRWSSRCRSRGLRPPAGEHFPIPGPRVLEADRAAAAGRGHSQAGAGNPFRRPGDAILPDEIRVPAPARRNGKYERRAGPRPGKPPSAA